MNGEPGTRNPAEQEEAPLPTIVVVPRSPGPLRVLGQEARAGDELDEVIDEVFGPPTDEGPGLFDAVLVLAGIALIAWAALGSGTGPWFAIGVGMVVLGVALPARSLLRAASARRAARRQGRILREGIALYASDPTVGALAGSYDALVHASGLPGITMGRQAMEAGHAALVEVASLLGGRPPLTDEERAYVERRTRAVRDLTSLLLRTSRAWQRGRLGDGTDVTAEARERAAAIVRAREDLEQSAGVGSVDELDRLARQLDEDLGRDRS
jgi:hypothetical protein